MSRLAIALSAWLCWGVAVYGQQPPSIYRAGPPLTDASGNPRRAPVKPKPHFISGGRSCRTVIYEGLPDKTQIPPFDGVTATGWVAGISEVYGGQAQFTNAPSGDTVAVFLNGSNNTISFANPVSLVQYYYATGYATTLTAYDSNNNVVATQQVPPNWDGNPAGYETWTQIQPLLVTGNQIARINIVSAGPALNNFLGIDEFEFCTALGIDSVEMTQAIQQIQTLPNLEASLSANGEPPVPIIAGKPGVMRVYMQQVYAVSSVNIQLNIGGVTSQTKLVTLMPGCSPTMQRYEYLDLGGSCLSTDFYFTPPSGSWTASLLVTDAETGGYIQEEDLNFTSRQTQPLRIRGVSVCDTNIVLPWLCGSASDLVGRTTLLEKIAPTNTVSLSITNHFVRRNLVPYCPDLGDSLTCNQLQWWTDTAADTDRLYTIFDAFADGIGNQHTTYYGLMRAGVPQNVLAGLAHGIPAHAAISIPSETLGQNANGLLLPLMAHETSHTLGLKHTHAGVPSGPCYGFAWDDTTDWPWRWTGPTHLGNTYIQSAAGFEVPFDVAARTTLDPESTYEIMSYCQDQWIAPQRYKSLIDTLGGGLVTTPSIAPVGLISEPSRPRTMAPQPFWIVTGTIPSSGAAQFGPLFQSTIQGDTSGGSGTYSLVVQNAGGSALFVQKFTPQSSSLDPAGVNPQVDPPPAPVVPTPGFAQLVPIAAGAASIVLKDPNGVTLGAITLGGVAPTVTITNPTAAFTGAGAIAWTVSDPDSASFTSRVYYSPDNGATWSELGQVENNDTSLNVDFTALPGANGAGLIEVLVSDGVNTGQAISPTFSIPKKTPALVQILSPTPNFVQPGADPVLLEGTAYDVDDGILSGNSLVWTSNLQGPIGSGSKFYVNLNPGVHIITLTATDSDNNSIDTSTTVTIADQPPSVNISFSLLTAPPTFPNYCLLATVSATPGANGAPVASVQYSIDGGNAYTNVALNQLPFTFLIPGVGFIDLVFSVRDTSNQVFGQSYSFFNNSTCQPLTVPNVVGQTQANAGTSIIGAGLVTGTVTTAASGTVPAGSVIGQTPVPGTMVPPGASASVNLEVSGGAQIAVPNVAGQAQATAATTITGAGLTVGSVTTSTSTTVPAGNVIGETPAAGTLANAGSSVNLVVSTGATLAISGPSSLPVGTVGQPYAAPVVTATGGSGNYTWSAPGLPGGLNIDPSAGVISGTPSTNAGSPFNVQVKATDSTYSTTANRTYTLAVNPAVAISGPAALPNGTVGAAFAATTVKATGGSGSYTWYALGLPPGMSIAAHTGTISGTPTSNTGSPFSVVITVVDSNLAATEGILSLTVNPAPLAISGPPVLPAGSVGASYPATTVKATGGTGVYIWSAMGLPSGLSIGSTTGTISGTPGSATGSPFSVEVTVTDSKLATASYTYSLAVSTFSPCDFQQNGNISVADVQREINQAVGAIPPANDLTGDETIDVVDIQIEINAVLGLGCIVK